jgi:glycerate 2-kinase
LGVILNSKLLKKQNKTSFSINLVLSAIERAISSVDPQILIDKAVRLKANKLFFTDLQRKNVVFNLEDIESIYVIGAGKATARMAFAILRLLKKRITSGAINVPYDSSLRLDQISITEAGHPIPDEAGIRGTRKIIQTLNKTRERDLVLFLISGGGSSLLPMPALGISLSTKQYVNKALLSAGACIQEINTVRKHLSSVKGGQIVRHIRPGCKLVSVIISDVIGDDPADIASGPTSPDKSSFIDAKRVLMKYDLWKTNGKHGSFIRKTISRGIRGLVRDTPKPGDSIFNNVANIVIGNNDLACRSALGYLRKKNVNAIHLGSSFAGQASQLGAYLSYLESQLYSCLPSAFILGGETIVNLDHMKVTGTGGRNQECALSALMNIQSRKCSDTTICCIGTDGIDGNSNAAGAILSPTTILKSRRMKEKLKSYMSSHDSYNAFRDLDSLIITGKTGTNVNDISIICKVK